MTNNPCCTCFGTHYSATPCNTPSTGKCGGCLTLGVITKTDCSMNLCGTTDELEIDFSCFCIPCANPTFKILNAPEFPHLEVVSISKDKLVVKSTGEGFTQKQTIKFSAYCTGDDDCTTLSDYGTVNLYFKGKCTGVVCETGYECDNCTGLCAPITGSLSVGGSAMNGTNVLTVI